ncbi:hypothetical protein [Aquiluna sp. KACHI24]|uniref:hypothetical protein n=1 Tax=Aquiluna sp. KACHI24 TaxID=2968831 RepID=UPI00220EC846|nr:hypothetical protein [Aquiluna sp. KACHI24]BDP99785.1 hypothetical protein AKACHI_01220 [Aquiluna sp. KACHI24]
MQRGGIRSTLATLFAVALLLATGLSANAKLAFEPDPPTGAGSVAIIVSEKGLNNFSAISAATDDESFHCEDAADPVCADAKHQGASLFMPVCASESQTPCFEKLSIRDGGSWSDAVFVGYGNDRKIEPVSSSSLPLATTPSLFSATIGGETLTLVVRYNLTYFKANGNWSANEMTLDVSPYETAFDPRFTQGRAYTFVNAEGKRYFAGGSGTQHIESAAQCLWSDEGKCGLRADFPSGIAIRAEVRAPLEINGWFEGRMKDPRVQVSKSATFQRISVEAEPVEVNRISYRTALGNVDVAGYRALNIGYSGLLEGPLTLWSDAWGQTGFEFVKRLRDPMGDKSSGKNNLWSVKTIMNAVPQQCLTDSESIAGFVVTNASVYSGSVPEFKDGYLSYQVAGMHYEADGKTLNLGTYDMVMRSDVARCLYGFSKAPISATVQVVGTAGEEKVATTIVNERDGWLKLAAYGFTFSEKEVRVTLTQAPQPKKVSANLSKFTGKATKLNASQRAAIESIISQTEANSIASCTAYFVKAADKQLAEARAKAACAYAQGLNPKLKFTSTAKQTRTKGLDGRVTVVSN